MKEQGDLFSSCVPVSVKRLDQDKDADHNLCGEETRPPSRTMRQLFECC